MGSRMRVSVVLLLVMAVYLAASAVGADQPKSLVGSAAPRISGTAIDGSRVDVPAAGRVTVVAFWNSTYRLSLDALQGIARIFAAYGSSGLVCVGINASGESSNSISAVARGLVVTYPLIGGSTGSNAAASYRLQGVPAVFVIDSSGVVDSAFGGWDRSVEAEVKARVAALL